MRLGLDRSWCQWWPIHLCTHEIEPDPGDQELVVGGYEERQGLGEACEEDGETRATAPVAGLMLLSEEAGRERYTRSAGPRLRTPTG